MMMFKAELRALGRVEATRLHLSLIGLIEGEKKLLQLPVRINGISKTRT
jgi:hypothetical protein